MHALGDINKTYKRMVKKFTKEEAVRIISATELNEDERLTAIDAVKKGLKASTLSAEFSVDPSILGGLQVFSGEKFIDLSLAQRYRNIKNALENSMK